MRHRSSWKAVSILVLAASVAAQGATYTDDFARADGDSGWIVANPVASILSEELHLNVTGGEPSVWAGSNGQLIYFDDVKSVAFKIRYGANVEPGIGAHGGVILCANTTGTRYSTQNYVVDWIQRDKCYRLYKTVGGTQVFWPTVARPAVAGNWKIEFTATGFKFYAGDADPLQLIAEVADTEHRSGYVGFWIYTNSGQELFIDDVAIEYTPADCPGFLTQRTAVAVGATGAVPVRIPTLANAGGPYDVTVKSMDPATAAPVGHAGGSKTMTFAQGSAQVQNLDVEGVKPGEALFSFEGTAGDCGDVTSVVTVVAPVAFEDDFAQADGPPQGWDIRAQTAVVINEELSLKAPGGPFVWFGSGGQAINVPRIDAVRVDIRFAEILDKAIGAHGGIVVAPEATAARGRGYMIDVIERASDNGFRIYKDNNAAVQLGGPRQPYVWGPDSQRWEVEFTPTGFDFSVDGTLLAQVADTTYRGGYIAFWCYTGVAGQNMFVDNVRVEFGTDPCPSITPASVTTRPVNPKPLFTVSTPFGANADDTYKLTVTSTNPAVAIPVGAVDGKLVLDFPQTPYIAQATFEGECLSPGTTEFVLSAEGTSCLNREAKFTVRPKGVDPFCDGFAQANGPPQNWAIVTGGWNVAGEELRLPGTTAAETWIWAAPPGVPSTRMEPTPNTYSFNLELGHPTDIDVGRHGGFMFCGSMATAIPPTNRWAMSGYTIDWINRASDRGYRFIRWDNGAATMLAPNTGAAFPLRTQWKVEFVGNNIQFSVDDKLVFDVVDARYREGHFGFWAYNNLTTMLIDDVAIGDCPIPPPIVRSVVPSAGPAVGGTAVTIQGDKFKAGAEVRFGGVPGTDVVMTSWKQITCKTPAHAAGLVAVEVKNPDGQKATAADAFQYVAAPSVLAVSPAQGPTAGGTSATVTGTGFLTGATVRFGGAAATGVVVTPTQITCTTPAHAAGLVAVEVKNPDGQRASLADAFTYGIAFLRGDTDGNGQFIINDGIQILERLFAGREAFTSNCDDAGDVDDNGQFIINDAILLFNFLFASGPEPAAPYPTCGLDPTPGDPLDCIGNPANVCP